MKYANLIVESGLFSSNFTYEANKKEKMACD